MSLQIHFQSAGRVTNTLAKDIDFELNSNNRHAKKKGKMPESGFETLPSRLEYPHHSNTPRFFRPVVSKKNIQKWICQTKVKAFQREWPLTSCTCRFISFYPFVQPSIFLFRYNRLELLCFQQTHHSTTILAVRFQNNGETTYRSSASLSQLTHTHTRDGTNGCLFFFF